MKNQDKYSFHKYSGNYEQLFSREKSKIQRILPLIKIEHIGSTSIPGLGGKGIIDIAIKTPKNKASQFIKKLEKLGYKENEEHPKNEKRIFLQKIIKREGKERRVHIHLALKNEFWNSFIVIRDYLRSHEKERKEYNKIKKSAVNHAKGDGKKYRRYKESFLEKILKLVLKKEN